MLSSSLPLSAAGLVLLGLLGGCGGAPEPKQAQLCCYRSLAGPDCYAQPLARDRERLIGCTQEIPGKPSFGTPAAVVPAMPMPPDQPGTPVEEAHRRISR
ncbi:hypothetical protein [Telmatospirillum sp. J64-1]|uniref:hypothetical protein n=1 Tax=Telmatospirillum sp. J64-1 TaxID=2502183 RepID=UPI00115DEDB6|nr:hypothetical protein [Telmatospirillum sp. J64-1]